MANAKKIYDKYEGGDMESKILKKQKTMHT